MGGPGLRPASRAGELSCWAAGSSGESPALPACGPGGGAGWKVGTGVLLSTQSRWEGGGVASAGVFAFRAERDCLGRQPAPPGALKP